MMSTVTLPYLGEINLEKLEENYSAQIDVPNSIGISIYLWDKTIELENLEKIKPILENISQYDTLNKAYFLKEFQTADVTKDYLNHHLSEIPSLGECFVAENDNEADPIFQLFTKLHLYKVWFSVSANQEIEIIFDYTIGIDLTQYKLVIKRKLNGAFSYITMES